MSDADCTPGREPRSVAASLELFVSIMLCLFFIFCMHAAKLYDEQKIS